MDRLISLADIFFCARKEESLEAGEKAFTMQKVISEAGEKAFMMQEVILEAGEKVFMMRKVILGLE